MSSQCSYFVSLAFAVNHEHHLGGRGMDQVTCEAHRSIAFNRPICLVSIGEVAQSSMGVRQRRSRRSHLQLLMNALRGRRATDSQARDLQEARQMIIGPWWSMWIFLICLWQEENKNLLKYVCPLCHHPLTSNQTMYHQTIRPSIYERKSSKLAQHHQRNPRNTAKPKKHSLRRFSFAQRQSRRLQAALGGFDPPVLRVISQKSPTCELGLKQKRIWHVSAWQ